MWGARRGGGGEGGGGGGGEGGGGGLGTERKGVRACVQKVWGVRNEGCDVCGGRIQLVSHKCLWSDVCVCVRVCVGRAWLPSCPCFPPIRSPEMPRPGCLSPLPFVPLALTKAFVLGFRPGGRWTDGRCHAPGSFVLFLFACVWGWDGEGTGRGCTSRGVAVLAATSQRSAEGRGPGAGRGLGGCPGGAPGAGRRGAEEPKSSWSGPWGWASLPPLRS